MSEPLKQHGSPPYKCPQPVKSFFHDFRISPGRSKAFIVRSLKELFKHKKINVKLMCFLSNCLLFNWRGEFCSVLAEPLEQDLLRRQEPPQPPHSLVFRKKAKINQSRSRLDGREHSFSFPTWDSKTDMIHENMAYHSIYNSF